MTLLNGLFESSTQAVSYPLDSSSSGLLGAFSFRRLLTSYTGNLIQLERASDGTTQDFGFVAGGHIDSSAIATFLTATSGRVSRIYDQANAGRFIENTTDAQQAAYNATFQNSRPAAVLSSASSQRWQMASSQSFFNALHTTGGTIFCVSQCNNTAATKTLFSNSQSNAQAGIRFSRNSSEQLSVLVARQDVAGVAATGTTVNATAVESATTLVAIYGTVDPDNGTAANRVSMSRDGVALTMSNTDTASPFVENAAQLFTVGSLPNGASSFDGGFAELVLWSGDKSSSLSGLRDSAKAYWGLA